VNPRCTEKGCPTALPFHRNSGDYRPQFEPAAARMRVDTDLIAREHRSACPVQASSPLDVLRTVAPRMARFGISRVADVTGLDRVGIPVAIAIRPAARSVSVSQGKGVTIESAKASALMEAVELWHAENIRRPLMLAAINEMRDTGCSCDVARLPETSAEPRSGSARLLWIEGHDLVSGRPKQVPFEMVHADYADPVKPGYGLFPASTNGLASGAHSLQALCSAICEVVERDAVSIWHHLPLDPRSRTRLDLSTVDDPACCWARDRIADASLELAAWDVTSDLGIPAFLCLVRDPAERDAHVGVGSGAHPNAGVALLRALVEAAQTRLTYITGSRDDLDPDEFTARGRAQKRFLADRLLRAGPAHRDYGSIGSFGSDSPRANLDWLVERLCAQGIDEIIAVDLSQEDVGIPVTRVIVPGLEAPHDDPGYILGARARAAAEGQLQ
jgi:ribosomal protein S12 methylthiotransferase accessory factor